MTNNLSTINGTQSYLTKRDNEKLVALHFIARREADSSVRKSENEIKIFTQSIVRILNKNNISPENYSDIYDISLEIYSEEGFGKGAWGIDYIVKAIKVFLSKTHSNYVETDFTGYVCELCKDTGFKLSGLLPVKINTDGVTNYVKCEKCSNR